MNMIKTRDKISSINIKANNKNIVTPKDFVTVFDAMTDEQANEWEITGTAEYSVCMRI